MGKMEQESQRFSRLLLGKANYQQCSLFASALVATDETTVMEEASKAFGEILNGFGMKSTSN
jgi:hypothetical protein